MDEVQLIPEHGDDKRLLQKFLAQGGAPAFVVRANRVQQAWDDVLHRCRVQREEWLLMVRVRLGRLAALAGDWNALRPWLAEESLRRLQNLLADLQPKLRVVIVPTTSAPELKRGLLALTEAIGRFNARWRKFLNEVDLSAVNEARDKYNRYYLLEKECVIGSAHLARRGFVPLAPLTVRDAEAILPLLPVIEATPE